MDMSNAMVEERFKYLFDQRMKVYEKQMQVFKDMMQALAGEMQALKSAMQTLEQKQASIAIAPKTQAQPAQKTLGSDGKPAVHPRQGNYKPEDVDIQKMFYFGHK